MPREHSSSACSRQFSCRLRARVGATQRCGHAAIEESHADCWRCLWGAAWELWTGAYPYPGLSKVQIMFGVASQDIRPEVPAGMPAWLCALVTACWAREPKAR